MPTTVIYDDRPPQSVAPGTEGATLHLTPDDLAKATGWSLKPEGLCRDDACVPLPADGSWLDAQGRVDLTAFAAREGRAVLRDAEHDVWAFGPAAAGAPDTQAPDFTFPDLDGQQHSLSDYRGRKVFLYTWGSYCGCSFDPPVWETVYGEIRDLGVEMISVASSRRRSCLDTAGNPAVTDRIRPEALDERPDVIRRLRGWSEERWQAKAAPSHPCLIDADHVLATSYGMSNVPMAVWIDEQGTVVRPPEPAGVSDHFRSMDPDSFAIPDGDAENLVANRERYVEALKDWVRNGPDSEYAMSYEQVLERTRPPRAEELQALLHIRVARLLYGRDEVAAATGHVRAASDLCPEKWNYRRQATAARHPPGRGRRAHVARLLRDTSERGTSAMSRRRTATRPSTVLHDPATALLALPAGQPVVLVDDLPRRSGDGAALVAAAATVTDATVVFLVRHGSGFLQVALPEAECERLRLGVPIHPQRRDAAAGQRVSVDAATGISTGISAPDRAHTVRLLGTRGTRAEDLTRPGHVIPLGVGVAGMDLASTAVGLCGLATGADSALTCAIVSPVDPRRMIAPDEVVAFATEHGLPVVRASQALLAMDATRRRAG
jgi:3,4-dihydroxy-2-butanone 4-phosphate synthase/peroxiredoxin